MTDFLGRLITKGDILAHMNYFGKRRLAVVNGIESKDLRLRILFEHAGRIDHRDVVCTAPDETIVLSTTMLQQGVPLHDAVIAEAKNA